MNKKDALLAILNGLNKLEQEAKNTTDKVNLTILNTIPESNPEKNTIRALLMQINHITGESGMYTITIWRPTSKGGKYTRKVVGLLREKLEALINEATV